MRVGWLHDDPGYLGGAELTMREFKAAAPEGVEVVDCPPRPIVYSGLDRYVIGNCMTYPEHLVPTGPRTRYHHDVSRAPLDQHLGSDTQHIFCSPLQRERMKMEGECIPPALDLSPFEAVASQNHREGAVCVGRMAYGKGLQLLAEFDEPVDVYSTVPVPSEGSVRYQGPSKNVAETLSKYETFVFLPQAIEPFGRAVVEAWAAGLTLVVNKNVGAMHWLLDDQTALTTAAKDFWRAVCQ